jgi:tRNA splicing endonuclease
LTLGGKFGSDFVVYEDDPSKIHGKALVFVEEEDGTQILEIQILSTTVKKIGIIASLKDGKV